MQQQQQQQRTVLLLEFYIFSCQRLKIYTSYFLLLMVCLFLFGLSPAGMLTVSGSYKVLHERTSRLHHLATIATNSSIINLIDQSSDQYWYYTLYLNT
jgi:hypothetical protein